MLELIEMDVSRLHLTAKLSVVPLCLLLYYTENIALHRCLGVQQ